MKNFYISVVASLLTLGLSAVEQQGFSTKDQQGFSTKNYSINNQQTQNFIVGNMLYSAHNNTGSLNHFVYIKNPSGSYSLAGTGVGDNFNGSATQHFTARKRSVYQDIDQLVKITAMADVKKTAGIGNNAYVDIDLTCITEKFTQQSDYL